jgi:hypothetical protein
MRARGERTERFGGPLARGLRNDGEQELRLRPIDPWRRCFGTREGITYFRR